MIRFRARSVLGGMVTAIAVFTLYTGSLLAQSITPSNTAEDASSPPHGVSPWTSLTNYDTGWKPTVAINSSGLIVEVHQALEDGGALWYNIGKLNQSTRTVNWGKSRQFSNVPLEGYIPSVAMTEQGYVLIVFTTGYERRVGRLRYCVGTLNPTGGTDQELNFKIYNEYYDTGWGGSVSINSAGGITEVHGGDGSDGLFYRLGHFRAPDSGNFDIVWDTGNGGQRFDRGSVPRVSQNNNGEVVEVHVGADTGKTLRYTRGQLVGNSSINFATTHPQFGDGTSTNVFLQDNGFVMETEARIHHNYLGQDGCSLDYQLGKLDSEDRTKIDWQYSDRLDGVSRESVRSDLASNGVDAILIVSRNFGHLKYAVAAAPK